MAEGKSTHCSQRHSQSAQKGQRMGGRALQNSEQAAPAQHAQMSYENQGRCVNRSTGCARNTVAVQRRRRKAPGMQAPLHNHFLVQVDSYSTA